MVSETLGYAWRCLRLNGGFGYFKTDGYDSRVYLYESGPLYTYSMGQFQGEGWRCWLMARATIGRNFELNNKGTSTGRPIISAASIGDTMSSDTSI